jgi:hypothetical protein
MFMRGILGIGRPAGFGQRSKDPATALDNLSSRASRPEWVY